MSKERMERIRQLQEDRYRRSPEVQDKQLRYKQLLQRCCTTSDWRLISPLDPDSRADDIAKGWEKAFRARHEFIRVEQVPEEECRRVADAFTGAEEVVVFPSRWESIGYIVVDADQLPYFLFDMLIEDGDDVRIFDEETGYGELVEINDAEPPTSLTISFGEHP